MEPSVLDFDIIVCVAGSRSYNDYAEFTYWLDSYVDHIGSANICFVSGAASNGADAMIIHWCKENNYTCFEYPADWDEFGKSAGMIRNAEMRSVITHLLAFWDGASKGTEEMINESMKMDIEVATIIVTPDSAKFGNQIFTRKKYHGKPKGGRAKYPRRY